MMKKLYKIYHKYYLLSLYQLINTFNCSFRFESLNDNIFLNHSGLKYQNFDINNDFLQLYKNDKIKLAEDILTNGMFFPFFGYKEDGKIYIILGKHRLYSLLLKNQQEKINTKFLFIYFDHDVLLAPRSLEHKYQVFKFTDSTPFMLIKHWVKTFYGVFRAIDNMGDILSREIFQFNSKQTKKIKPSELLNNENLFKLFVESPLDKNNLLFKYYNQIKIDNETKI